MPAIGVGSGGGGAAPKGGGLGNVGNALRNVAAGAGRAAAGASKSPTPVLAASALNLDRALPKYTPPAPHVGGGRAGGVPLAAISSITGAGVPILHTLVKQVANLPESTLVGLEGLGGAVIHDVTHGGIAQDITNPLSLVLPGSHTALGKTVRGAVTADPVYQSITKGSFKPLEQNPLGALLDATGVYGLAGKSLGAIARSGAVGENAARAAALGGRAPREVAPGILGTARPRGYSPNLFTQIVQKARDNGGSMLPQRVAAANAARIMKEQVAATHAAEVGQRAADETRLYKTLKANVPAGKEEKAIAPLVAATGQNRVGLERLYNDMLREPMPKNPDTQASREANLKALSDMIAKDNAGKFDWGATNRLAAAINPMATELEVAKHALNLQDVAKMDTALGNKRALLEPNVHYLDKPTTDPRLVQEMKDAKAASQAAQKELKSAEQARAAYLGTPGQRGAYRGASAALSDLQRSIPVHPVTDNLMNKALDMRQILESNHPEIKAFHDARVAYLKERAANATKALQEARKAVGRSKLQGTVIEDHNVPQVRSGPLKGMSVRPITPEDVAAIRANDPAIQSYISARNPDRELSPTVRQALGRKGGDRIIRPAESGNAHYTGESLLAGDYRAGWSAIANSMMRDIRNISATREEQNFLDRFSLPHPETGLTHFPTHADALAAAREYAGRTGIRMTALQGDHGDFHVVPTAAVRELNRQRSLDQPSVAGKLLTKPNNLFRKTVLPFSPKLPIMHTVENASRIAMLEKGNIPRALADYARGKSILEASSPAARQRLETLTTPGALSRSGVAGENEMIGRLPAERGSVRATVHAASRAFDSVATTIIHGQRWLERRAQVVALGAHARQMLQESGKSWLDANTAVKRYSDELARGLATPQDAERAAQAMHKWMGQYNAFPADVRLALRLLPFGSWYANAARLVFVTLPRDHPLFDAVLQDTYHAMQPQWQQQHQGLPADMQSSLNVGPNAWLDVGKLTPIGVQPASLQGVESTLQQLFMPEFTGPALTVVGKGPFMQDLKLPGLGYGQSIPAFSSQANLAAIDQLLQSIGGPLGPFARGEAPAGQMYNADTPVLNLAGIGNGVAVKPNSEANQGGPLQRLLGPQLDRILDPMRPTTFHQRAGAPTSLSGASANTLSGASVGRGPLSGATVQLP